MMGMFAFHQIMPQVGLRETRTAHVLPGQPELPADDYGFLELYCVDPKCDCRRVVINVLSKRRGAHLATINHAFAPPQTNGSSCLTAAATAFPFSNHTPGKAGRAFLHETWP